ncbi:uncharacterized protein LOC105840599 [Monomorium pharaonis]|uniref:uncharacterized protein LOC105840599 n=1 Tax=Monomorium pharaonis TaxID=307658 RepID=UPI00174764CC|nr:uncharacterized protein LOC105840599 [Monomorium pharaonis]
MRVLSVIFPWLFCLSVCDGYRLLALFPFQGKSHFVMFEQLIKGLARKGHQIDVVSQFPLKKPYPNYTDIVTLPTPLILVNNMTYDLMLEYTRVNPAHIVATIGGNDICNFLRYPAIKELSRPKNPPYDAVLMEVFGAHCFGIIAYLLKVPLIGVSSSSLYPWIPPAIAQPENLAFVPNNLLSVTGSMNFWQRLYNTVHTVYDKWYFDYLTRQDQDRLIRENFGSDMPGVRELEKKLSLVLINSQIALNGIQPKTPAAVDVGGLHIQDEDQTIQPELEKWLNDSKNGFIYFSFGSMVIIETFPREFLRILYASLGKIAPVRVLMKIPTPENLPPGLPENIHMSPWMPQIKILKHPNIKAFITHGGLMGAQEAITYGVPMIGIPLFADQFINIDTYVARNIALRLDLETITEKSMDAALNAILWDPLYRETARNLSRQFLDRPLNTLDTANYWIEYVIKYGENSLRSPAMDLTWWQLYLIDVIGFLVFCVVIVIVVIVFIVRFMLKIIKNNSSSYSKKINKMRVLAVIFFLLFLCLSVCDGYRFLGLFPFQAKSHFVMFEQLMKGLVRKGHQVDMVGKFPLKKPYPNYTDIVTLPITMNLVNNISYDFMNQLLISANPTHTIATLGGNDLCEYLGNPAIKELAQPKNPPYDAVFIEVFGAHCFGIIAHLLKVPLIGVSTTSLYPWLPPMIAQSENLAFVPNNFMSFPGSMTFWQRLHNTVSAFWDKLYFNYITRQQDKLIREHFGPDMPGVRELERKLSLVLINSHIALNGIQPRTPAAVDVGGLHVQDEDETLQPELEKWLNESKDGFVYFTFGSMVMIETFSREFLRILYASLGKIAPVRVLMKIPTPENLPPGLPENIHISPWMPQIKILKHPNVRAFITHGGLMGTQEAVTYGVPMIGIPLFADQFVNIDRYVAKNIALRLDVSTITEKSMDAALNAILRDPLYKDTAQNLSRQFLDRPLNAIDTANYWIEYIVKYGENSLRSPAMDLSWWQLSLVDVIGFLVLCVVIVIAIVVFIVRFVLKIIRNSSSSYSKKIN